MALVVIFLLGVGNFALHRAVIDSGHRLVGQPPLAPGGSGRKILLATEFLVLLLAMLLAANGWPGLAWAYFVYTCINGFTAWLILSGRA
jgi:hypothetical protein